MMQILETAVKRTAALIAEHMDKLIAYYTEMARINREVAAGTADVYTVRWPKNPGISWPVEPVVWVMADGSPVPNPNWRPHIVPAEDPIAIVEDLVEDEEENIG